MTKQIELTQSLVATVDDEDYDLVSKYKWCALKHGRTHYAVTGAWDERKRQQRNLAMHRLLLSAQTGQIVDHIDHDGLNNTRANIRIVTSAQSNRNRRKNVNCSSGYKGVCLNKKNGRWMMKVSMEFATDTEAAEMYDKVMRYLDIKHAVLNFNDGIEGAD